MSESPPSPKRIKLESLDLADLTRDELIQKLKEQDKYVRYLEEKSKGKRDEEYKEMEAKLKQHQRDSARRENTLVHRLTTKEQELQDYINQIQEFKQSQTQNTAQLKSMLLDPAVNLVFQRMTKEMEDSQEKLRQTQNELSAWKFTADSQTGKRLMAKCRMLIQENEELGKVITSGRTAKLEGEIATQKELVNEMKSNQADLDEFLGDLDEDVEGMQSMIYVLQQQLKEAKDQVTQLQEELAHQKNKPSTEPTGVSTEDQKPNVTDYSVERTSPKPERTPPKYNEGRSDRTPPNMRMAKTEKSSHREIMDTYDRQTDLPSEEESMDTDSYNTETKDSSHKAEVNHIFHHHHSSTDSKVQSQQVVDKLHHYDHMNDSQDSWSSPVQHDNEGLNGQSGTQSRDSTPELDSLHGRNYSMGREGLQNGMNRTSAKTEEMGEA